MFIISLLCMAYGYGYLTHELKLFPYYQIKNANRFRGELLAKLKGHKQWFYQTTENNKNVPVYEHIAAYNAPTMFSCIGNDEHLYIKIVNMDGSLVHQWKTDWFDLWPKDAKIHKRFVPQKRPGTNIHGIEIMDNGDIVFIFEDIGMICLDVCGNLKWHINYSFHHSLHRDEEGNFWVSGNIWHESRIENYSYLNPVVLEPTVVKVSPDGKILSETSVFDILRHNELESFLIMQTKANITPQNSGDILHLNDVEPFPASMEPGFFRPGDVLISLRNMNTVLVYNLETLDVKYQRTGKFIRQHDPDFIDGNTISLYDNNNLDIKNDSVQSRIVMFHLPEDRAQVIYSGSKEEPFFSKIMGKHQWLPNENLLITDSLSGRVFEIDKSGKIVWEYFNLVEKGYTGIIGEAKRISPVFNKTFFEKRKSECRDN